jgi:hypothetical protein
VVKAKKKRISKEKLIDRQEEKNEEEKKTG